MLYNVNKIIFIDYKFSKDSFVYRSSQDYDDYAFEYDNNTIYNVFFRDFIDMIY